MASYGSDINVSTSDIPMAGQQIRNVSGSSEDEQREGGGHIRVGREYQAVLPAFTPPSERMEQDCAERAMLVWSPSQEEDAKLDKYIHTAIDKYGYNREQALAMLFWHKHDMDRALQDLANFTPVPNEWSMDDKLLFEQAFKIQGKSFKRIQQMLPEKSIGSLVQHYYGRTRTSLMDMQTRKLTVVREDSYAEPVANGEKVGEGLGGGVEKDSQMSSGWPKVSGLSQEQQRTESPSRRLGSFSQLPTLAGRGAGQGYSQMPSAGPGQ